MWHSVGLSLFHIEKLFVLSGIYVCLLQKMLVHCGIYVCRKEVLFVLTRVG
jgi:hypothetical protein